MEGKKDNVQDVELAVLAKEVEHMGKSVDDFKKMLSQQIGSLGETIKGFIEIANKKVDRDVYLEDKRQQTITISEIKAEIKKNEDFRKTHTASQNAKEGERKTIFGVTQGTISTVINMLTIITLIAAVTAIFK